MCGSKINTRQQVKPRKGTKKYDGDNVKHYMRRQMAVREARELRDEDSDLTDLVFEYESE
jgi:hypothetical protein